MLLLFGGLVVGVATGALILGALASAGATAYATKTAVEGDFFWEDPEAWFTGLLKGASNPIGEVISDARGQPTIMEALQGAEAGGTAQAGPTGSVLQGATGQAMAQAADQARAEAGGPKRPFQLGGAQVDVADAEEAPSRHDILKGARKQIGIGLATLEFSGTGSSY